MLLTQSQSRSQFCEGNITFQLISIDISFNKVNNSWDVFLAAKTGRPWIYIIKMYMIVKTLKIAKKNIFCFGESKRLQKCNLGLCFFANLV